LAACGQVRRTKRQRAWKGTTLKGGTPSAPIARIGLAVFDAHAKPAILSVTGIKPAQSAPSLHSQDCA
jgi:hypothetical protein